MSSRYDELERLQRLRESGALNEEEFQAEKRRLLGHDEAEASVREDRVVVADEPPPSRLPLYLILGGIGLIVALVAGLLVGRLVGGKSDTNGMSGNFAVAEEDQAGENLIQPPAAPDVGTLPPKEQLAKAFEAAFGSAGSATVNAPADASDGGGAVTYRPDRLIQAPFGPVLVSEGEIKDAPHVSGGRIGITYLRAEGDHFAVARSFPEAVVTGSFGHVGKWSVSPRFSDWPVIAAEGGGTWQGYTCSVLTLTELRPAGPAEIANIALSYDDGGASEEGSEATHVEGKLINIVKGESFDVVYSGSQAFSDHYVRSETGWALAGGGKSRMPTC
jgi:Short C-terminal domain